MDVLIYKTALIVEKCPDWLTLGYAVELKMLEGGKVAAHVLNKEGWFLLFGKGRLVRSESWESRLPASCVRHWQGIPISGSGSLS